MTRTGGNGQGLGPTDPVRPHTRLFSVNILGVVCEVAARGPPMKMVPLYSDSSQVRPLG